MEVLLLNLEAVHLKIAWLGSDISSPVLCPESCYAPMQQPRRRRLYTDSVRDKFSIRFQTPEPLPIVTARRGLTNLKPVPLANMMYPPPIPAVFNEPKSRYERHTEAL
jgi:hypothetical protein